jgi:chromosomal replication initiation ATPase DnaA
MKRTIEYIEKIVCKGEFVEAERLHTSDRSEPYNTTRQMIMVLAIESGFTFKEAGAYFERDHSTVTSARRSIYNRLDTQKPFKEKYKNYKCLCNNGEVITIDFLAHELARLKTETMALVNQLNQIAI